VAVSDATTLSELSQEDVPDLFANVFQDANPDPYGYVLSNGSPESEEALAAWVENLIGAQIENGSVTPFTVRDEDDRIVGICLIVRDEDVPETGEPLVLIGPSYRQRGHGRRVLQQLTQRAWDAGFQNLEGTVKPANTAIEGPLSAAGFERDPNPHPEFGTAWRRAR
jgi:RimJ/RimL family protein N-acetyltransferase